MHTTFSDISLFNLHPLQSKENLISNLESKLGGKSNKMTTHYWCKSESEGGELCYLSMQGQQITSETKRGDLQRQFQTRCHTFTPMLHSPFDSLGIHTYMSSPQTPDQTLLPLQDSHLIYYPNPSALANQTFFFLNLKFRVIFYA